MLATCNLRWVNIMDDTVAFGKSMHVHCLIKVLYYQLDHIQFHKKFYYFIDIQKIIHML